MSNKFNKNVKNGMKGSLRLFPRLLKIPVSHCLFLRFTVKTRECEIIGDAGYFILEYCYVVNISRNATCL